MIRAQYIVKEFDAHHTTSLMEAWLNGRAEEGYALKYIDSYFRLRDSQAPVFIVVMETITQTLDCATDNPSSPIRYFGEVPL